MKDKKRNKNKLFLRIKNILDKKTINIKVLILHEIIKLRLYS